MWVSLTVHSSSRASCNDLRQRYRPRRARARPTAPAPAAAGATACRAATATTAAATAFGFGYSFCEEGNEHTLLVILPVCEKATQLDGWLCVERPEGREVTWF